jgi:hypothetical protein
MWKNVFRPNDAVDLKAAHGSIAYTLWVKTFRAKLRGALIADTPAQLAAIEAELEFLKSLLPKEKK